MTNPVDPKKLKSHQLIRGISLHEMEIIDVVAVEELMLQVEQIFEEAEELWRWMYNE
jgi:hypothetical protein